MADTIAVVVSQTDVCLALGHKHTLYRYFGKVEFQGVILPVLRCYEDDNDAYSFECLEDVVQVLDEENAFYGNLDYSNGGVVYWLSEDSSKITGHIDAETLDVVLYSIKPEDSDNEDLRQFMSAICTDKKFLKKHIEKACKKHINGLNLFGKGEHCAWGCEDSNMEWIYGEVPGPEQWRCDKCDRMTGVDCEIDRTWEDATKHIDCANCEDTGYIPKDKNGGNKRCNECETSWYVVCNDYNCGKKIYIDNTMKHDKNGNCYCADGECSDGVAVTTAHLESCWWGDEE